jgi:putative phosphoesterase
MAGRQQLEKSAGKEMTMSIANAHGEPIIVGLVSDTHGLVRSGLFRVLGGVSQIFHAGDVGGRDVLDALRSIAPVQAVYGNVDPIDGVLPDEIVTELGGVSIHVSHGHELGSPTPAKLLSRYSADILVFGHTHHALVERSGKRLVINPGAAGPKRFDVKPSVAILRIAGSNVDVEIVPLG